MALNCGIHYKTIALISSDLKLSDWFWRDFWNNQKIGLNFDGELYGSGFTLQKLIEAGLTGPDEEGSNCCLNGIGLGNPHPDWLLQTKESYTYLNNRNGPQRPTIIFDPRNMSAN